MAENMNVVEDLVSKAVEKLDEMMSANQGKPYAEIILKYIKQAVVTGEIPAEQVLDEHKTWDCLWKYVCEGSRDESAGNCTMVEDSAVYARIREYFALDEKETVQSDDTKKPEADAKSQEGKAIDKLEKELSANQKKPYAINILNYVQASVATGEIPAAQVLQEHKNWDRLWKFVYEKARKNASGNCAMVEDSVVYGWVREYYALDDKDAVEKEEAAKKKAEEAREKARKKAEAKKADSKKAKADTAGAKKANSQKAKAEKAEDKPKETYQQASLFDFM